MQDFHIVRFTPLRPTNHTENIYAHIIEFYQCLKFRPIFDGNLGQCKTQVPEYHVSSQTVTSSNRAQKKSRKLRYAHF